MRASFYSILWSSWNVFIFLQSKPFTIAKPSDTLYDIFNLLLICLLGLESPPTWWDCKWCWTSMLLVKCDIINLLSLYLLGNGTPSKEAKRFERSTPIARIAPTRIDSLKKLPEMTKGQSISDVIQRKILWSTRLTELWQVGISKTNNIWCCC